MQNQDEAVTAIKRMVSVFNNTMNAFLETRPTLIVELGFVYDDKGRRNLRVNRITDTLLEDEKASSDTMTRLAASLEVATNEIPPQITPENC
jgi:hypothetical protein